MSPTSYRSSELVRLLARMADGDVAVGESSFVQTLGQWLHWTDAIALSSALAGPAEGFAGRRAATPRDVEQVSQTLRRAIDDEGALDDDTDLAAWRRLYLERQQTMERAISALRAGLRTALAQRSPALARLAAVDAALETALAPRERAVLGGIPALVESHFRRLQAASPAPTPQALRSELRRVLHAELELRLAPARGLAEALSAGGPAPTTR